MTSKKTIWSDLSKPEDIILHEKDLKEAIQNRKSPKPEYIRFKNDASIANYLYNQIDLLIRKSNITTLGCVIKQDDFNKNFPPNIGNEISLVCLQVIIENFTHFLHSNNATGKIVYESRNAQDKEMRMRFFQIASIGTMYVLPSAIQSHIRSIEFYGKHVNCAALQVADFIPNQIARKAAGFKIYQNVKSLTRNIFNKSYDGYLGNKDRYGINLV